MVAGALFIQQYVLEAELGTYPPFIVREARRLSDDRRVIVKIYCKLGQSAKDINKVETELQFWRLLSHPKLVEITELYNEEGFIYILYEFPAGGDLAALALDPIRTFTEGFAKKITRTLLEVLIFLHANGIVHGAVTPSNIVFIEPIDTPGWVNASKVAFFRIDNSITKDIFTDLQDVAYSLCCILRQRAGLLSHTYFNPNTLLQQKDWQHVTDDFVDFIHQLWSSRTFCRTAESFLRHPWLTETASLASHPISIPTPFAGSSPAHLDIPQIKGYLYYKMREKSSMGRRQWRRRWAVMADTAMLLYPSHDENRTYNQELAVALDLKDKIAVITTAARYDYVFGVQDINSQQIVLWLRFDSEADYTKWRDLLHIISEAPHQKHAEPSTRDLVESVSKSLSEMSGSSVEDRDRARALVDAVDEAARNYARQIEAQTNAYIRNSSLMRSLRSGDKYKSFKGSMSPYPSEQKSRVHPAVKWDMRSQELMLVMSTGTPVNMPVLEGQLWFVIDAVWFRSWIHFVSSRRRTVPPGPIDNLWMINPESEEPYEHLIEDTDDRTGDFRRVPPQIWELFEQWYGGGPAISFTGPPSEDTRRWEVDYGELPPAVGTDENKSAQLKELAAQLERPEDLVTGPSGQHVAVKLQAGRRPSVAELRFLASASDFNDAEKDTATKPLEALESSDEESEEEEAKSVASASHVPFAPLTAKQLELRQDNFIPTPTGARSTSGLSDVRAAEATQPPSKETLRKMFESLDDDSKSTASNADGPPIPVRAVSTNGVSPRKDEPAKRRISFFSPKPSK